MIDPDDFGQLISNCFFSRAGSILVLGASGGHDVASGASNSKRNSAEVHRNPGFCCRKAGGERAAYGKAGSSGGMKVRGKITIKCENAGEMACVIARSLSPDNVSGIRTDVDNDSAIVTFSADKMGTMLCSVVDYLMNAKIAEDNLMIGMGYRASEKIKHMLF